jgi:hypothetical protein
MVLHGGDTVIPWNCEEADIRFCDCNFGRHNANGAMIEIWMGGFGSRVA